MVIHQEMHGDVLVLRPFGHLNKTHAPELKELVFTAIDSGIFRIVFDFSMLDYISSDGLRIILTISKKLQEKQGRMAIAAVRHNVSKVFEISGFFRIFNVFTRLDQALAHIRQARAS